MHTDTRALENLPCEVVKTDILNKSQLLSVLKNASAVIHSAAHISITGSNREEVWKVNVEGTKNVIEATKACGVERLIYIGSIHAFKDSGNSVDENSPLIDGTGSIYDITKAEGVKTVRQAINDGLNAVILCPTALIGPNDFKPSFIGRFLISLAKKRVPALVNGGFDWVDARDVAEAALSALTKGNGTYILSGKFLEVRSLAKLWCETATVKCPDLVFSLEIAIIGAKATLPIGRLLKFNPLFTPEALKALTWKSKILRSKSEEELNFKPRPLEETLYDTYKWFREHGYL